MLDYLGQGRSIDSPKRRASQMEARDEAAGEDDGGDSVAQSVEISCEESVRSSVAAREIIAMLSPHLDKRARAVLGGLEKGSTVNDIAQDLDIAHQLVTRIRDQIAKVALKAGIRPWAIGQQTGLATKDHREHKEEAQPRHSALTAKERIDRIEKISPKTRDLELTHRKEGSIKFFLISILTAKNPDRQLRN